MSSPPFAADETFSGKDDVSSAIEKYADMVRRICFLYLGNRSDVEDVFQDVFLQYFIHIGSLQNEQHRKAWLCRVTFNKCKDLTKSCWYKRTVSIDDLEIPAKNPEENEVVMAVLQLPPAMKQVIYLHYYEGWTIPEIAQITQQNINSVYSQLRRAKARLKQKIGGIDCEEFY